MAGTKKVDPNDQTQQNDKTKTLQASIKGQLRKLVSKMLTLSPTITTNDKLSILVCTSMVQALSFGNILTGGTFIPTLEVTTNAYNFNSTSGHYITPKAYNASQLEFGYGMSYASFLSAPLFIMLFDRAIDCCSANKEVHKDTMRAFLFLLGVAMWLGGYFGEIYEYTNYVGFVLLQVLMVGLGCGLMFWISNEYYIRALSEDKVKTGQDSVRDMSHRIWATFCTMTSVGVYLTCYPIVINSSKYDQTQLGALFFENVRFNVLYGFLLFILICVILVAQMLLKHRPDNVEGLVVEDNNVADCWKSITGCMKPRKLMLLLACIGTYAYQIAFYIPTVSLDSQLNQNGITTGHIVVEGWLGGGALIGITGACGVMLILNALQMHKWSGFLLVIFSGGMIGSLWPAVSTHEQYTGVAAGYGVTAYGLYTSLMLVFPMFASEQDVPWRTVNILMATSMFLGALTSALVANYRLSSVDFTGHRTLAGSATAVACFCYFCTAVLMAVYFKNPEPKPKVEKKKDEEKTETLSDA